MRQNKNFFKKMKFSINTYEFDECSYILLNKYELEYLNKDDVIDYIICIYDIPDCFMEVNYYTFNGGYYIVHIYRSLYLIKSYIISFYPNLYSLYEYR